MTTADGTSAKKRYSLADLWALDRRDTAWWVAFVIDPISDRVTWLIANYTKLTPNVVTVVSIFVGLGAAGLYAQGDFHLIIAASLLFQMRLMLDVVDGRLARLTGHFSKVGAALDHGSDLVVIYLCLVALIWSAYQQDDSLMAIFFGAAYGGVYGLFWLFHLIPATLNALRHAQDSLRMSPPNSRQWRSAALVFFSSLAKTADIPRPYVEPSSKSELSGLQLTMRKLRRYPSSIEAEALTFLIFPLMSLATWGLLAGTIVMSIFVIAKSFALRRTRVGVCCNC